MSTSPNPSLRRTSWASDARRERGAQRRRATRRAHLARVRLNGRRGAGPDRFAHLKRVYD